MMLYRKRTYAEYLAGDAHVMVTLRYKFMDIQNIGPNGQNCLESREREFNSDKPQVGALAPTWVHLIESAVINMGRILCFL